jgi:hypothetical protein
LLSLGTHPTRKANSVWSRLTSNPSAFFAYIKDKATWTPDLSHGEDIPADKLADTDWKDFEDPIVGTLISNFFIAYFGQDQPHRDLTDEEIMAKLVHLGSGYELWANTAKAAVEYVNNILTVIKEIKAPESIKWYLDPTRNGKSLQLAMANGPFGAMTNVQSKDYPVAAHALKKIFQLSHQTLAPTLPSFPSGNVMLQLPSKIDKESEAKKALSSWCCFLFVVISISSCQRYWTFLQCLLQKACTSYWINHVLLELVSLPILWEW